MISHDAETWYAVRLDFDPLKILNWLNLTLDQLISQAEHLRHMAATHDVLGDFHDLVRRANPTAWETLRGEARIAMDYHIAAEMLDRFAEEANHSAPPAAVTSVRAVRQRLSARPRSLDAVLTGLHLSPHPSVVVGVEGATEKLLVSRVANLLGITLIPRGFRWRSSAGRTRTCRCWRATPRDPCSVRIAATTSCSTGRQPGFWS